jgi:hypothetical protein
MESFVTEPIIITSGEPEHPSVKPPKAYQRLKDLKSVKNFLDKYQERFALVTAFILERNTIQSYSLIHIYTPVPQNPTNSFYETNVTFVVLEDDVVNEVTVSLLLMLRNPNVAYNDIHGGDPPARFQEPKVESPVITKNPISIHIDQNDTACRLSAGLPDDDFEIGDVWMGWEGREEIKWQKEVAQSWFTIYHRWRKLP